MLIPGISVTTWGVWGKAFGMSITVSVPAMYAISAIAAVTGLILIVVILAATREPRDEE